MSPQCVSPSDLLFDRPNHQRTSPTSRSLAVDTEALSWFGRLTSVLSLRHQVHDLVMRAEFEAFFVAHKRERILDLREKLRRRIDLPLQH